MDSLGSLIKAARKERNWTQKDLAKKSGFYPADISGWETSETAPKLSSIRKLAVTLGKPIGYFLEENKASWEALDEGEKKAKLRVDSGSGDMGESGHPITEAEKAMRDKDERTIAAQGKTITLYEEKIAALEKELEAERAKKRTSEGTG